MGYQLRMHREIHDWLTGLQGTDPTLARQVGEAVLALLDGGAAFGPPLVVPLDFVLRQPEDPRDALDASYQRQLETLTKVRRGVADVATSRKRVELQIGSLEQQAAKLASQREQAAQAGREDIADTARAKEAALAEQFAALRRQYQALTAEEEKLTAASQRLQAKVEAFRVRKETIKASYTAAAAAQSVRAAFADISAATGDPEAFPEVLSAHGVLAEPDQVAASADALLREAQDLGAKTGGGESGGAPRGQSGTGSAGAEDAVAPPPGMMLLRSGAPDGTRAGVLFVVAPPDTAVLLAHVAAAGPSAGDYQAAIRVAVDRMPLAPAGEPPAAGAPAGPGAHARAGAVPSVTTPAGPAPAGRAGSAPGGRAGPGPTGRGKPAPAGEAPAEQGSAAGAPDAAGTAATGETAAGTAVAEYATYSRDSFLDEFFPGAETEVEVGAGVLISRSWAYTLAEARQRMKLTQAQVAQRMNVRQERVSAIERAAPGATEVRTLAAYVSALGGRLEIVAHIGDERITLR